jgi:TonB family protein
MSETRLIRLWVFAAVTLLHLLLLFRLSLRAETLTQQIEQAREIRLVDIQEWALPPEMTPLVPEEERIEDPVSPPELVDPIAEHLIETDEEQPPVAPSAAANGTATSSFGPAAGTGEEDYLPMHVVAALAVIDEKAFYARLVYPRIARNSGIEGYAIVELFIDRHGEIKLVTILQEDPENRGFGEAAQNAFTGMQVKAARASTGEPVASRRRYRITFVLK